MPSRKTTGVTGPGRWETDRHIARLVRPSDSGGTGPAQWQVYAKDEAGGEGEWQQSYPTRSEAQAAIRRMEATPADTTSPTPGKPIRVLPAQMQTGDRFPDGATYLTHSYIRGGIAADVRNPDGSTGRRRLDGNIKYDMTRATPADYSADAPLQRLDRVRYGNRTGIVVGGQETGRVMVKDSKSGNVGTYKRESLTRIDSNPASSAPTLRPEPADSPVWQKPNTDLSEQDKQDMYDYAWDLQSYADINSTLRSGDPGSLDPETTALANRMTDLIERSKLPANARLYRGTFDNPDLADEIEAAHRAGQPWTEKGFMSTSLEPDHANSFADNGEPGTSVKFQITVDAPEGSKALVYDGALADHEDAYDQREVLLQRGSQFRIDSAQRDRDGNLNVQMTLTAQPTPDPIRGPSEPRGATGTPAGGAGTGEAPPGAPEPSGPFYHATDQKLVPGDRVVPANQGRSGMDHPSDEAWRGDHVWMARNPGNAGAWWGHDNPGARVYEVVPEGPVTDHSPTEYDRAIAAEHGDDQALARSARVVRELPLSEWNDFHKGAPALEPVGAPVPTGAPEGVQPEHEAFIQRQVQAFHGAGGRIEPVGRDQRQAVAREYSNQEYEEKRAAGTLGQYDAMRSSRDATIRMALDSPNVLVARDQNGRIVGALGYRPKGPKNDDVNGVGSTGALPGTGAALEHALAQINAPKGRGISGNAQNFKGTDSTGWHRAMGKRIGTDTNSLGFPTSTWTPEDVQRVAAVPPPGTAAPEAPVSRFPASHRGPWTSDDPATPYSVITSHEPNGEIRAHHFPTHEAADEYAKSVNPDTDGSMRPNLPAAIGEHPNYSRGYFWPKNENRYAATHKAGYDPDGRLSEPEVDPGWPNLPQTPMGEAMRLRSNADIRREVDYQEEEYDIDKSAAMESVADALGIPWSEVDARYHNRRDLA